MLCRQVLSCRRKAKLSACVASVCRSSLVRDSDVLERCLQAFAQPSELLNQSVPVKGLHPLLDGPIPTTYSQGLEVIHSREV